MSNEINFGNLNKRESAAESVIKTIKRLLITNELHLGDRLPSETKLSEILGISRGSVREAMKILSAYGIVDIKRGDGTYIAASSEGVLFDPLLFKLIMSSTCLNDFKELREMLELSIIKLAIRNATTEDILSLEKIYVLLEKSYEQNQLEYDLVIENELMFHSALGKATGNKLIQTIYNVIMDLYVPNIYKSKPIEIFYIEALNCHRPIINAIINKDIIMGEDAIKKSVDTWETLKL